MNVLKRIGKYLDRFGKLTIYHSFIMSNFMVTVRLPDTSVLNKIIKKKKQTKYKNVLSALSAMIQTAHTKHYSKLYIRKVHCF